MNCNIDVEELRHITLREIHELRSIVEHLEMLIEEKFIDIDNPLLDENILKLVKNFLKSKGYISYCIRINWLERVK